MPDTPEEPMQATTEQTARGAAGREAAKAAFARRRRDRAIAELEAQGYTVILTKS